MTRYGLTRDQAFDLLRIASQHRNRKLSDIATEVAETGALELPRTAGRRLTRSGTSAKALHNPSSAVFQGLGEG
jgi:hypothetical protein